MKTTAHAQWNLKQLSIVKRWLSCHFIAQVFKKISPNGSYEPKTDFSAENAPFQRTHHFFEFQSRSLQLA
jgi:hypothetical protein